MAASRLEPALHPMPSEPGDVINARLGAVDVFAARSTRDGPDGVDLFCRTRDRQTLLDLLRSLGIEQVGESAWQMLHMEWGIAHVGTGIDPTDTPIEAGLEHLVAEGKGAPFPGESALAARRRTGALKRLVGFHVGGSRRPPVDAVVRIGGHEVDRVRAVSWSPRTGVIGFTAVPTSASAPGTTLSIEADDVTWAAEIVERPFVARPRDGSAP
jgi:glycine dehydrogenase subunit 1